MTAAVHSNPIIFVRSLKGTHFTGAIAQNAQEAESIAIPDVRNTNEFIIEAVSLQSDQQLDWDIFLWGTDGYDNTDLDLDFFVEFVSFATSDGKQIAGAGQFYYASSGLNIPYKDLDGTGELHLSLVNRNASAKNAGGTGEVVIVVSMRPVYGT